MQYLTKEHAKALLEAAENLLDVTYETGLSSPGRLHDLFVTCEAVTPGEFKSRGAGLRIAYGFHPSPFGECLLAMTERGVCGLVFVQPGEREQALQGLRRRWALAELVEDPAATRPVVEQVFDLFRGKGQAQSSGLPGGENGEATGGPLRLHLSGTNFQIKVWEALLRIPSGRVVSYEDIAVQIGMPRAARAVSNAVAQNPVPVLIPCHRVIRKAGDIGGYRWGTARKKALLGWEAAHPRRKPEIAGVQAGAW
jgi:AraC family transcriptional regulator of adaptative response/methylated-DNA-[protein]-cysteine methyltransferase